VTGFEWPPITDRCNVSSALYEDPAGGIIVCSRRRTGHARPRDAFAHVPAQPVAVTAIFVRAISRSKFEGIGPPAFNASVNEHCGRTDREEGTAAGHMVKGFFSETVQQR
jgi:hypothetical protein